MNTKTLPTLLLLASLLFSGCGFLLDEHRPGRTSRHSMQDRRDYRNRKEERRRNNHRDDKRHNRQNREDNHHH